MAAKAPEFTNTRMPSWFIRAVWPASNSTDIPPVGGWLSEVDPSEANGRTAA